ncbi:DUF2156 domain-containing protein [Desulfohalovibrio reitneri]|uniref:DUF2156 domain-containing protein n=1 Tax=Desulfohalovibrio reitneri TaxID=1307759 RepID=UPI0004A6D7FB|nr:phosphatidylglycerol lysyltransferase domain-containing protein [Desulfohalovibrio reitneri]
MDFEPVSLDLQDEYRRRFEATPARASDYSFINLWGWCEVYGLTWRFDDELVWIRQEHPEPALWAPVGPWDKVDWSAYPLPDVAPKLIRVPEELCETWLRARDGVTIKDARDHWDYVYRVDDLRNLPGKRYKKKRDLLEQFKADYDWDYRPLSPECVEEVLDMQLEWCRWRDRESDTTLQGENEAIRRTLTDWDRLKGITGGALRVDNRIVAYTVADALAGDPLVVHFEKGHTRIEGVYQAINQMFLEDQGKDYAYVNREQDLGDPGLRRAKLSYDPSHFVKKFEVIPE